MIRLRRIWTAIRCILPHENMHARRDGVGEITMCPVMAQAWFRPEIPGSPWYLLASLNHADAVIEAGSAAEAMAGLRDAGGILKVVW